MRITAESGELRLTGVEVHGALGLEHLVLGADKLAVANEGGLAVQIPCLRITLVLAEKRVNAFLDGQAVGSVRNLRLTFLSGRIRAAGRYYLGKVPIPFTLVGVPEVEGETRIRLESKEMTLLAAALPGIGRQALENRINQELANRLDVSRLPFPTRLTEVRAEPGRLTVSAEAVIKLGASRETPPGTELSPAY